MRDLSQATWHRNILHFGGLIYLTTFVVEAVVRTGLLLIHHESLLYARDAIAVYGMLMLIAFPPTRAIERGMMIWFSLFSLSFFVGFLCLGSPAQILFGAKIYLPLMLGLSVGAFDSDRRFLKSRWFIVLLVVSSIGVCLEAYYPMPWKGLSYMVGGVEVRASISWHMAGFNRISGFARSSYAAAVQILLLTMVVDLRLRNIWVRTPLWLAGAVCITLTTTKSIALSLIFIFLASIFFQIPRASRSVRSLPAWVVALTIVLPFIGDELLEQIRAYPTVFDASFSYFDRVTRTWPQIYDNIEMSGTWILGRGMGSVGAAQGYFENLFLSPGDNLFMVLYSTFGVAAIPLLGAVAYLAGRARDTQVQRLAFLVIVAALVMGVSANVVEDGFFCVFIGYAVSVLINQSPVLSVAYSKKLSEKASASAALGPLPEMPSRS